MPRRVRFGVGTCLWLIVAFIEAAEMFHVVRDVIPETLVGMVSQKYALPLFIVGALFIWLGKVEGNKGNEMPKASESDSIRQKNTNTNTVSTVQTVEQYFHLVPPVLPEATKLPQPLKTRHNVQFISPRKLVATDSRPLRLCACFENVPIPDVSVPRFSSIRSKIQYFDEQGRQI
jgi:hypothetical protein